MSNSSNQKDKIHHVHVPLYPVMHSLLISILYIKNTNKGRSHIGVASLTSLFPVQDNIIIQLFQKTLILNIVYSKTEMHFGTRVILSKVI